LRKASNIYRIVAVLIILVCSSRAAEAQNYAVSTNVMSWAGLGTINAEGSLSVHRHISLHAGAVANPWKLTTPTNVELRNRQYGGYAGVRYWPWHVYSEWWVGAKLQYKHFNQLGLLSSAPMKGHAFGPGISGGYTFMLSRHVNLDLGVGIWGGGLIKSEETPKAFVFLDNVIVSFVYIF